MIEVYSNGRLEIYEDVLRRGYFNFSLKGDKLTLTAGNHVGLIPLNERVALHVEPKIAKDNWLYMVGRARGQLRELAYLRGYSKSDLAQKPLLEFLARAFIQQLKEVEQQGLYRQYKPQYEVTAFPRGRILFRQSMLDAWSHGHTHSVAVRYYEFSKDTSHNRLLKYALLLSIRYITSFTGGSSNLSIRMSDLENLFANIPLDQSLKYLPDVVKSIEEHSIPESREYYEAVCNTAILLVEHSGLSALSRGPHSTLSFVVNMETIFEEYSFHVLHDQLNALDWDSVVRGKFDEHPLFCREGTDARRAEPDLIIRSNSGCLLLIEIKYKPNPNRQDINQAVTYALSYNSDKVVLLCFAEDETKAGWEYLGSVGGNVSVWTYRIHLEKDMVSEESKFVKEINEMMREA